jgi:flavin reductase (DIM6/NTAB) family NADH-FMN oxidoreductase RutF/rubredoxin
LESIKGKTTLKINGLKIKEKKEMIEKEAFYKLTYGLFVLTTKDENGKDNGCIVNTVSLITDDPKRITVYVNKANYTEEVIRKTGVFNACVLTESAPFSTFKQFGFQSGRDTDKTAGENYPRTANGLIYIPEHVNSVISAKVIGVHDYGTHTLFVAEVTEAAKLSDDRSVTYEYYLSNIKPKPTAQAAEKPEGKEKWVCKICGYEHEGELPDDFICPWCKHPASDFERVS